MTVYGKVKAVTKSDGSSVTFNYDGAGNRVTKTFTAPDGTAQTTHYVRDASGNAMAIYRDDTLREQPIYGSARLGHYTGGNEPGKRIWTNKQYELTNHLGNVMAVISDRIIKINAGTTGGGSSPAGGPPSGDAPSPQAQPGVFAHVLTINDYYPFGLEMPGRSYNFNAYRYGFNGKEKDDKGEWGSTHYDYGFRIYNPQIGKFLSVDPLTRNFPGWSPYPYAMNRPIDGIDLDGLEFVEHWIPEALKWYYGWKTKLKQGTKDLVQASTNTGTYNNPKIPVQVQQMLRIQQLNQGMQNTYDALSEPAHVGMDLLGSVPLIGEPIDALHGAWYAAEGKYAYAGMSFASAIGVGEIFKYSKYVFKYGDNVTSAFGKQSTKYAEKLKDVDVKANKVRFFDQGDPNKVAVIGRGQKDRVEKVAKAIDADTFNPGNYPGMSVLEANKTWIKEKLNQGYSILDIGLEPSWTAKGSYKTGDYYGAEIEEIVSHFGKKTKE